MTRHANALAAYGKVANIETDPIQQIVMLYEGAIKFLRLAAADIDSGDLAAKAEHSNRALDIIGYLQSILDYERGGDVAPVLNGLYASITAETLKASAKLDSAMMLHAADMLVPVRDAWASNVKVPPVPPLAATSSQAPMLGVCLA